MAPSASDTIAWHIPELSIPLLLSFIHEADTDILSVRGDGNGGRDVEFGVSTSVVNWATPALWSQNTLVLDSGAQWSLVLVIVIIIFQIHSDRTKPG